MTGIVNYLYLRVNGDEIAVSEKIWSKFMMSNLRSFPPLNINGVLYRMKSITPLVTNDEGGITCYGEAEQVEE